MNPKNLTAICPGCGTTRRDWLASHQLGCYLCYDIFQEDIELYFQSKGFSAAYTEGRDEHWTTVLQEALAREDYEEAARLRDFLKSRGSG